MFYAYILFAATDIAQLLKKPSFSEPRLMIFKGDSVKGFIVVEKEISFEVTGFSVCDGIVCLIASYYVFHVDHPQSTVANNFLLSVQELLCSIC